MKADIKAADEDRGEPVSLAEPLLIGEGSRFRGSLTDLALELAQKSAGFRRSLPESLLGSLADLVRAMNCYYSNLIEGHDTHPVDIERALKNDYSKDAKKRDLQLEAQAHIAVQKWIDDGGLKGRAVTSDGIREIHRRFCELLPEDLLWVEDPETKERVRVVPGELRKERRQGRRSYRRQSRRRAALSEALRGSLQPPRQDRFDPGRCGGASSPRVDSPVC